MPTAKQIEQFYNQIGAQPYSPSQPGQPDQEYAMDIGRVDFEPLKMDIAVLQHAYRMIWQKSSLCSCISQETGQPDPTCPACSGTGFLYFNSYQIFGLVYAVETDRDFIPLGQYTIGKIKATIRAQDHVTYHDRLIFPDTVTVYSENLIYNPDANGYVKLHFNCVEMDSIHVLSKEITDYEINAADTTLLHINDTTNVQPGMGISVRYYFNPVYVVEEMPHEIRGTSVKKGYPEPTWFELPKQVVARREDIWPLAAPTSPAGDS